MLLYGVQHTEVPNVLQVRNLLDSILQVTTDYILHTDYVLQVRNLLDYVLQVRTDYVLQVRNLLTMYYKLELTMYYRLELTMYYYCLWYDKLWGPSQRVVTLFIRNFTSSRILCICTRVNVSTTVEQKL